VSSCNPHGRLKETLNISPGPLVVIKLSEPSSTIQEPMTRISLGAPGPQVRFIILSHVNPHLKRPRFPEMARLFTQLHDPPQHFCTSIFTSTRYTKPYSFTTQSSLVSGCLNACPNTRRLLSNIPISRFL